MLTWGTASIGSGRPVSLVLYLTPELDLAALLLTVHFCNAMCYLLLSLRQGKLDRWSL